MQIEIVKSIREYQKFTHELYKDDAHFKDNKTGLLSIVCSKSAPFYKNSMQKMVAVKDGKSTLCQAIFIIHKQSKEEMSVAFFEALPNQQEGVNALIKHAEEFGKLNGVNKLVFGLEGHCNHSVGFSTSCDSFPTFGESYQNTYYHEYFMEFMQIRLVSNFDSVVNVNAQIEKDLLLFKNRNSDISYEYADFGIRGFRKTMKRYTDLNNRIFMNHRYYFKNTYQENYHLFKSMRLLLKNENLIFAKKNNNDIGFIFWYPDFNELVARGHGAGVTTFVKYKILKKYPQSAKVVEIGLIKGQRNSLTILMLLSKALDAAMSYKGMSKILSSWILDENNPSKNTTQRYTKITYKDFFTYEKDI